MSSWAMKPGQTLAQAKQQANQSSAYNYGQAQPKQDSYATSSPYQKNPAGDFAAYSPQGTSPFGQAPKMPTSATDGNWANYASPQRPPAFQASYGSPFGGQSQQPNFAQRDAFIQSLNNQATPYMTGQQRGPVQYDMNAAMGSANQMLDGGFQNPFNFGQTLAQQSFPSQYQPAPANAIRARGPGDPPERPAAQSPYSRELERMLAQGSISTMTAGRANSPSEQMIADALNRGLRNSGELTRARDAMQSRPAPTRFNPNASQMVAGMVQSTGNTGYGAGSGQGGPNPGAIGYTDQRFQLPKTLGRKRGLGTSSGRSPVYI
jgi:hypothetical protein